ncbi:hypothetical protein CQW23_30558 [Capsicum baccatum]|uniref:Uncharacterized protein n=1 Tax=Capsicum baccatum TaxID=33114 RepID=A0A2G2VA26_CAPBA|nr:hypothetical protein CQW23_30558 [Capsicum baccatum]
MSSSDSSFGKEAVNSELVDLPPENKPLGSKWIFKKKMKEDEDIPYWPKPVAPVCIHYDSKATIGRARSMMYNGKSRHIRRRNNTVRELLSSGIITVDYVKSKDNMPDPLIKGLSREGVERTSKGIGLSPRTSEHSGKSTYQTGDPKS